MKKSKTVKICLIALAGVIVIGLISGFAQKLAAYDIAYLYFEQIDFVQRENMTKVEPYDITKFRCEGFVEYCYEYYGYRICGGDNTWDISSPGLSVKYAHSTLAIMPKKQAQEHMVFVTENEESMRSTGG